MPFGAVAHRQHVVGEVGGLVPGGGQRDEAAHLLLVGEHLHPAQPVRVGPHRVVDAGEVGVEPAAAVLEQVREQETQLVLRQRVLLGPGQVLPDAGMRRHVDRPRHELVPGVGERAALGGDRAEQRGDQEQASGTPASRRGCPAAAERHEWQANRVPAPATTSATSASTLALDPRFCRRVLEREVVVEPGQDRLERLEGARRARGGTAPGTPPSSTSGGRTRGRTGRSGSGGWRWPG